MLRRRGLHVGPLCRFLGRPLIRLSPGSKIELGEACVIVSSSRHTALGLNHPTVIRTITSTAEVLIGDHVGISGATICSAATIRIGDGVLIGANALIID